jgi:type II secretory pathway pseudopilin PulG
MRRPERASRDRGDTLLELVVAVAILSVALVAVLGVFATGVMTSEVHRKQATAGAAVRDYAEAVQGFVTSGGYVGCAAVGAYGPTQVGFDVPDGYAASVVAGSIAYWNGVDWTTGCSPDLGAQRLTVRVSSDDGRATEDLVVVARKPCRPTDTACG